MAGTIVESKPAFTEWEGRWTLPAPLLPDYGQRLIMPVNRARCAIADGDPETGDSEQVLVMFWFEDAFEPDNLNSGKVKVSNSARFVIPLGTCLVIEETAM